MATSRIPTDEDGFGSAWAIGQLEEANRKLLERPAADLAGIEAALAERDEAVRAIADADPETLGEPLARRLLQAFEDGQRIRRKLALLYRDSESGLQRMERMASIATDPGSGSQISAIG